MLQLAYDYQVFLWQPYGGISRYIYELATRIARFDDTEVQIYALAYVNQYLKQCPEMVVGLPVNQMPRSPLALRLIRRASTELFRLLMRLKSPDVVHETFFQPHRSTPDKTRTVITVHDMIHERFQHQFPQMYAEWGGDQACEVKRQALQRADHIICVSQSARNDALEMLKVDPNKVSVVYNGGSFLKPSILQEPLPDLTLPDAFLLYVGQRGWYKNFEGLVRAYARSDRLSRDFHLVCFGGRPFSSEELNDIAELGVSLDRVLRITGSDRVLAELYQRATALVYPSLYEGFGIPPLEAMSFNCPVICTNVGSLPEVVGEAAALFNPYNLEETISTLEETLYSPSLLDTLIQRGHHQHPKFSWDLCAEQTHQVYRSLAGQGK